MVVPTISLTEKQAFTALRTFLLQQVSASTEVIRAFDNLVPEPVGLNFIVMTPLRQMRLGTNETTYFDNIATGSIADNVLTVTAVSKGRLSAGLVLTDKGSVIQAGTSITAQTGGTPGGVGTYTTAPGGQTVTSETFYAGQRADLVQTEWVVQLDVHGPSSADTVRVIDAIFRSDLGVQEFQDILVDGLSVDIAPLYALEARQMPFENAEKAYEYRWVLEVHCQINPVVGSFQDFAEVLDVETIIAAVQSASSS